MVAAMAAMAVWAAGAAAAAEPTLRALRPETLVPFTAATLTLAGEGFAAGAVVFIETEEPGRFLRYAPRALAAGSCEVSLPLGFGPRPARRRVYLGNPDGARTAALELRIEAAAPPEPAPQEPAPPEDAAATSPTAPPASGAAPSIERLRPETIPAGQPVLLEILGAGFADGAQVLVTVNVQAGTSRLPEYAPRAFAAAHVDDTLLEVTFDRGFYPVPGGRDVVVENPGGARSAPAVLTISPAEEEPR